LKKRFLEFRQKGLNRQEIYKLLLPKLDRQTPKLTTIYNVFKRNGLNRLTPIQKKEKKNMIIKNHVGELANIDCLHIPKGTILGINKVYLLGVIDAATRLTWVEVMTDMSCFAR
jgi:hypothetical protein